MDYKLTDQTTNQDHADIITKPGNPPARFDDIISRLRDLQPDMKPAEQRVAAVVLADVESAVRASNATLAAKANVSEPTVTRFCRTLGCDGVRDFKLRLAQSLVVGNVFLNFRDPQPAPENASLPFWNDMVQNATEALRITERQLDQEVIKAAAVTIAAAKRVYIFGVGGGSTALALDTQYRLFRYGVSVTAYTDIYLMRMVASTLGPEDVVLAISATGRTPEVVDAVGIARQYHAQVIAITRPETELAAAANLAMTFDVPEFEDILTPTASRFAFMLALDLLAAGVGYQLASSAQENLRRIKYTLMNRRDGDVLEPLGD